MNDSKLHYYKSTRVLVTPSGELMLALPIYADEAGAIMSAKDVGEITGINLSIGIYDHIGYIIFHPEIGECVFSRDALRLFEDLGEI